MTTLNEWAIFWNIPQAAVLDLMNRIKGLDITDIEVTAVGETRVQQDVRREAADKGCRLWRNNVGAFKPESGGLVRYGLCNESERVNKRLKSSDLIGIKPIKVREHHIGQIIGQFLARETKRSDWTYTGKDREAAQLRYLQLVLSLGGDAAFAKGRGTI